MLIEVYKGIEINHNAEKDIFTTNIVVFKAHIAKKNEYINGPRLQKVRIEIDKFLNTSAKKPVLKKVWIKGRYESSPYELREIIIYNPISNTVMVRGKEGKIANLTLQGKGYNEEKIFLSCKQNDLIIKNMNAKTLEIEKIKKETSC